MRSSESSKRQRRHRQVPGRRGATIKALPENSQPVLWVPGKHHVVFLLPIVSVADGFKSLVIDFSQIVSQAEAWTKSQQAVILNR